MELAKLREINTILQNLNEDQEESLELMLANGFAIEEATALLLEMHEKGYTGLRAQKFVLTPLGKAIAETLS